MYFLLTFHLFRYEKELNLYEEDEAGGAKRDLQAVKRASMTEENYVEQIEQLGL